MIYSIVCQEDYENFISSYLSAPPTPKKEKAKQEPPDSHLAYIPNIFTQFKQKPFLITVSLFLSCHCINIHIRHIRIFLLNRLLGILQSLNAQADLPILMVKINHPCLDLLSDLQSI